MNTPATSGDPQAAVLTACLRPPSLGGAWKRVIDVMVAGVALVVLTPILLMTVVLIRL